MSGPMVMCIRVGTRALFSLLWFTLLLASHPASAQLLEGMERWADSTAGLSSSKWGGPRVPFPPPRARPQAVQRLDSLTWPLSIHAGPEVAPQRLREVLAAAEATHELLSAAGFLAAIGDAGQAGTPGRDLYLVDALQGAVTGAALDASSNFTALDGARAYALLDARVTSDRVLACTAQALIDAQLFELDPAESAAVRKASAAYFAMLLAGSYCDDAVVDDASKNPFLGHVSTAARWLERLSIRQDQNRGTFLFDMWQFARQRTWEGEDLRASPDLLEAIDRALELEKESLALVAAELAESDARAHPERLQRVAWSALPSFTPRSDPALGMLGSKHVRLELAGSRAGLRLRAWARGEAGGRYVLSALRLDAHDNVLARLELEPRRDPTSQLSVELDERTRAVLVSVTRYADEGVPDPDRFWPDDLRPVGITLDNPP